MRSPFGIRSGLSRWHELMGSVAVIDAYAVAGFSPDFVADFTGDYYRTGGSVSTFDDAVTHARSGNATMVDSDGLLKWAPHNLVPDSTTFVGFSGTFTTGYPDPDGGNNAVTSNSSLVQEGIALFTVGVPHTCVSILKAGTASTITVGGNITGSNLYNVVDLETNTVVSEAPGYSVSVEDYNDDGWKIVRWTVIPTATSRAVFFADSRGISGSDVGTLHLYAPRVYRSDLGGMVDNPDRGDSYVPTTSAARYLPRRGNHVWNGSAWVNEGYLHESETPARVNLETQSQSLSNYTIGEAGCTVVAEGADRSDFDQMGLLTKTGGGTVYSYGVTLSDAGTKTFSVWLKSGTISGARIQIGAGSTGTGVYADVDMGAGTITSAALKSGSFTAVASTIEVYPSGWVRASVTAVCPATNHVGYVIPLAASVGDTLYFMAPQLEAGSTPSSYIPTSGSTVTRAADTLTAASANLPWPSPVVIGEELVTNGDFELGDNGDWTLNGTAEISSGTAKNLTGGDYIAQSFPTEAGKVYELNFDFVSGNTSNSLLRIGTSVASFSIFSGGASSNTTKRFVATSTTTWVTFYQANFTSEYDNISVREINPLAVSIQMDGTMTYAKTFSGQEVIFGTWRVDDQNRIYTWLNTGSARTGAVEFRQASSGVGDQVVQPSPGSYSPGINVPFNIASRHGSTFINGAVDGTALTANTTPTALPDLSATDLSIASTYMGNIGQVRIWADDLGDAGLVTATAPSLEPSLSLTFDGSEGSFTVSDWSE